MATSLTPHGGATLGMKPKDFQAFKAIAGQQVKGVARKEPKATRSSNKQEPGEFLTTAKERFRVASDAEADIRTEALDDLKFLAGDQWPDAIRRQRQMDQRPCLTINRLPSIVRQVTNEQRQNRPSIQIDPVGDGSDEETAEVLQGLIRHIEYNSGADAAYDTAFFHAAVGGFGYFRVTTEYSDPLSFDQEIKIQRVRNPFTVYLDPHAKEPDFSDAEFAFVVETMSKEAFKEAYPKAELSAMQDWTSTGDGWVADDSCRVAEYWWRERTRTKIVKLNTGEVVSADELPEELPEGISILAERETDVVSVRWAKINGQEVLEETEWAGKWIPIVRVIGDEFDIDGKVTLKGVVRDAKEPQQQYNFMKSASTEAIALAPKAPFVGAIGQFEGREKQWAQANTKSFAYLEYNPKDANGNVLPPPQRMNAEPAIQAITAAMMESADDLKAVTGVFDASLGAQGNETSGKAILARAQQAEGGNFHLIDNLTRALRHCGRILIDLIPTVYDTPRVLRIVGAEGDQKQVTVNQSFVEQGVQKIYDLTTGTYDVRVEVGPSYHSRRQEAVESMLALVSAFPAFVPLAGDLLVKNMDWPGAEEVAERLKKMLPPQLQDDADGEGAVPPQVQQQVAGLMQHTQQLQQALQQAEFDLKQRVSVKKTEMDAKERIAAGQIRVDELRIQLEQQKLQAMIAMAELKVQAANGDADAQRTYDMLSQFIGQHHEAALQQMGHEQQMQRDDIAAERAEDSQQDTADEQ